MPRPPSDASSPATTGGDGAARFVEIVVQPRASRTAILGWQGEALKMSVAAPPVDGAANAELIRFFAKRCGVPRSAVQIAAGAKGRRKRIGIEGMSAAEVVRRLGEEAQPTPSR